MAKIYDVLIIGGGIIGANIAYRLSRYNLKIALVEKNPIFGGETTTGNSGVIHGGFDPEPHKIEAKLNVLGNQLWQEAIFPHIDFPRKKIDSLVIAYAEDEIYHLKVLYDWGLKNGVQAKNLKILNQKELQAREPHLNPAALSALLCTSSWAIDPVEATKNLLAAAYQNGVELFLNTPVSKIDYVKTKFHIQTTNPKHLTFQAKNIINAAGHYADEMAALAGYPDFKQTTKRGEYRVLARSEAIKVKNICFMIPTIHGKGVIVAPTLDGRVLIGPTAEDGVDKADARLITSSKFDYIGTIGKFIIPSLDLSKTEISFAGSRPIDIATNDFVINCAKNNQHFLNAAGMQSPGLSAAPAVALEIEKLLVANKTELVLKPDFNPDFKTFWSQKRD